MRLVEDTGFEAGTLADSWRQQSASRVYCTDLTYEEIGAALAAAERDRLPPRRAASQAVFAGRMRGGIMLDADTVVRISRALLM